jgi:(R,R)-butanediol dehydrogenase / meso-butanediol dehydrogenase / diacetyl reductase
VKAVVTAIDGGLALAELTESPLMPGQARVAVRYCGICGSDLHWRTHFPLGTVMGHEVAGRICELASDVAGWQLGERVVILPADACGSCRSCKAGNPHICSQRPFGIGGPRARGGYADRVVVRASMLVKIPDTLPDLGAVLVEPLAVGLHGALVARVPPDAPVAVMGAGTIGLMTVLALRALGCRRIVAIEPNPARRALVEKLGLVAVDPRLQGTGVAEALGEAPAFLFECAGHDAALTTAVRLIAPRGRIVLLSAPSGAVPLPQWDLISKEAEIVSAIFYRREEFERAVQMLDSGAVPIDALPVSVFALATAPQALRELLMPGTAHMKVLLEPREE